MPSTGNATERRVFTPNCAPRATPSTASGSRGSCASTASGRGYRGAIRLTTDSKHSLPVAPNLLNQNFVADRPDRVWLADITYIPTAEGWVYLAVLLDLCTRKVVGWAMRDHMRAELTIAAPTMAIQRRRPRGGLVHHADRGSQYAAGDYRAILQAAAITQSMSRKGNCWDNAPMESFFGTLKTELVHQREYPDRDAARRDLFAYIEGYYNRQRRHSAIGYITPEQAQAKAA